MADDPWEDPSAKAWVRHVLEEMAPKLSDSACVVSLVPESRDGDVKFWVELGASIMMDKPIIAVILGDAPVPKKLTLVADKIINAPNGIDSLSTDELTGAIASVLEGA